VTAGVLAIVALAAAFYLAGRPAVVQRTLERLERVLPSTLAGLLARVVEKFSAGLGVVRRPGRLLMAFVWSLPLWLSIGLGIWAVTMAFGFNVPFTGSFLLLAILAVGVAVPTPGQVGGFDEAFRLGATVFFGAPHEAAVGAAIVLHVFSMGPALVMGLFFAAQAGLNLTAMRKLGNSPETGTSRVSP